jgi:DNA-binding transcriptional LysR family regulator
VEATRASAGIGLLPCFMADRHDDLIRVLPGAVAIQLTYWLVTRAETLRRPEVAAVVDAIRDRVHEQRDVLLGSRFSYATDRTTPRPVVPGVI